LTERFGILCASPRWTAAARTAAALTRHGAEICVVAPPDSIVSRTRYKVADVLLPFDRMNRLLPAIMRTLAEDFGAHSVLAGDDLAFTALAKLVERMDALGLSESTQSLLRRSMPETPVAKLIARDSDFIAAQHARRCPPPPLVANPSAADAVRFAADVGFPVLVKRDGYAAGMGVTQCEDQAQLAAALEAAPAGGCVVQKFVQGATYGVTVSGVKGRAMAAFSFLKHTVAMRFGPTSVAKFERRDDILIQSREIFEECGLNGFAGFDYMIDADGRAHLIEINPRIMPTGHFGDCFGVDLAAAFLAGVRARDAQPAKPPTHEFVALFPAEWMRDPESPHLASAYHDVPWDDPPLLAAMIDRALHAQQTKIQQGFAAF
jgi:biotin carboxylase